MDIGPCLDSKIQVQIRLDPDPGPNVNIDLVQLDPDSVIIT